ncbi:pathogenesis-related protein 5-like [Trifolium pratense]|uniref:Pathogenesis-related protein 5-like n=1 Tax=Trifolium pratense TaxID=57577 RepID=A0A2K3NMU3_TRIPR|nr:pathogenesis-related protein 5-like [Trifolium pratense]
MWPGILTATGKPQLIDGGIKLKPGQAINITAPKEWSGRFWGRRGCAHLIPPATENASQEIVEANLNVPELEANRQLHWQSLH